jgi:hypothetical protein
MAIMRRINMIEARSPSVALSGQQALGERKGAFAEVP